MPQLTALDIGSNKIKIVSGRAGKKSLKINKFIYAQTPADAINNGEIIDMGLIREALTAAVKNNKLSGKNAVVTIQSSTFISREFIIPKLKPAEAESTLTFEVERYLPIALEDYVMSHRYMEDTVDENGNQCVKYMVGLMPRRIVTSYYDLLKAVGLKPVAMDVNSNCIEKLLSLSEHVEGKQNQVLLVADIGNDAMDMTVFESGFPMVNRTVPIGGGEITRSIANTYGLEFNEAEAKKLQTVRLVQEPKTTLEVEAICNLAKTVIDDWAEQLRRMLEFHMSRTKGRGVDLIYLYGGSSGIFGLESYISEMFSLPVKILQPPGNVRLNSVYSEPIYTFLNAMGAIIRR